MRCVIALLVWRRMTAAYFRWLLPISVLLVFSACAYADTRWNGALGGSWFESSNWSNGIPDFSTDALIDSGIAAVPANASAASALRLTVGATNASPGVLLGVSANRLGVLYFTIGRDSGSSGLVSFTQAAEATNIGSTIVGDAGTGVLTVESQSVYSLCDLSVGARSGSTGTVILNGSGSGMRLFEVPTSDFESFADIGVEGTGIVEVKNGASFEEFGADLYLTLGTSAGGNGRITASGTGSLVDAYDIQAGVRSQGTLQVQSGALLTSRTIALGSGAGGTGSLSISGAGSKVLSNTLTVGSASGSGAVVVENGALLESSTLLIGGGQIATPSSVEVKAAEIRATSIRSADGLAATLRLSPGGVINTGELDINSQTRVEFQLDGAAGKVMAGNISFDGVFVLELANGYIPQIGGVFDLFDFTSASGQFDSFLLAPLPSGLAWDTASLLSTGEVRVVPEPQTVLLLACGAAFLFRHRRSSS